MLIARHGAATSLVAVSLLCNPTLPAAAAQQPSAQPRTLSLRSVPLADGTLVRLDGALDEPVWQTAEFAGGFRQREPDEGASATEATEVRVLHDGAVLYIGVWAFDSQPEAIIGRQLERDAPLGLSRFGPAGGDDAIELVLDTFHDRRNAYYFATNPRGIQVDGLITDESENPDTNWDGVWDVRTRVTSEGWTAEFAIPLRTLRFPARSETQAWGFNVQRVVVRKNEQTLWTAWSRDNEGLHRVSRAGELTGLDSLTRPLDLYIKPYILAEAGRDYLTDPDGSTDLAADVGFDAKLGLASGLVLDLTVNTDFAQVEADDEQIDLTRFNLFFPEKREFFLENAGIFQFGAPEFFGPPHFLLLFSRRIGLQQTGFAEAQTVPIISGARLTGRTGKQTVGFLNVVTGEEESVGAPLANFAVARLKRDIGQRSYVGGIGTHRLEEGGATNLAGGVDWDIWLSKPLVFEGFVAGTSDSEPGGDGAAWQLKLDYTGDWFGWVAEHMEIGDEVSPGIGFVRRLGIARSSGGFRLSPRPPIRGLRKINIFNSFQYVADVESRELQDRVWEISVTPQLDSGDQARLQLSRSFQRLDEPFQLTTGVSVPEGDYADWSFSADLTSSRSRPLAAELFGATGGFWDGERWQLGGGLQFRSPHIGLELQYSHNEIDVPAGAFTTDLIRGRIKLALNTRLFGSALFQYNSQAEAFSANVRIDFIHRPGSDLFIVINERRATGQSDWQPTSRALIVKLTYLRWF